MNRIAACAVLGLALLTACNNEKADPATATGGSATTGTATPTTTASGGGDSGPVFCSDTSKAAPCYVVPHDVKTNPGYNTASMVTAVQAQFDNFSWQSFVGLNWPANSDGTANPNASLTGDQSVVRVWDLYKDADEIFLAGGATPDKNYPSTVAPPIPGICSQHTLANGKRRRVTRQAAKINHFANIPDSMTEASVDVPLIDSNGNFVVYSVSVNRDEFEYIFNNGFYNASKQTSPASFPPGVTGGAEGAIETKSSWKILTAAEQHSGTYITRTMQIYVPAVQSASGSEFCTEPLTFGLIGLHIVHKTTGDPAWVWSTFEHVQNAPLSSTPLPAQAKTLTNVCKPPVNATKMSLYDPACRTASGQPCPLNVPPVQPQQNFIWQTSQPYAKQYLINNAYGTQVVRCSSIFDVPGANSTVALNKAWQAALPAPYSSYMLVGSQWFAANDFPPTGGGSNQPSSGGPNPNFPTGSVAAPPFLANVTAETYLQNGTVLSGFHVASCLGCHTFATGAGGQSSDFSFILDRAQGGSAAQQQGHDQRVGELKKALAARTQ